MGSTGSKELPYRKPSLLLSLRSIPPGNGGILMPRSCMIASIIISMRAMRASIVVSKRATRASIVLSKWDIRASMVDSSRAMRASKGISAMLTSLSRRSRASLRGSGFLEGRLLLSTRVDDGVCVGVKRLRFWRASAAVWSSEKKHRFPLSIHRWQGFSPEHLSFERLQDTHALGAYF